MDVGGTITDTQTPILITNIEWEMMNKAQFFPLSMLSSFCVRGSLYPLTLIKTRLQLQKHDQLYKGLLDAGCKIYKNEGLGGLYRGFWVSSVQILSGTMYIATYEGARHVIARNDIHNPQIKSLIAGASASLVGQTIIVPFDVISQHLMVLGLATTANKPNKKIVLEPLGITIDTTQTKFRTTINIAQFIYKHDGFKGFYRGYVASLCAYVPNSALWWTIYHMYQDKLSRVFPDDFSHLFIQCMSGTLGGFTTTLITNPLDTIRARLQVSSGTLMQLIDANLRL
uniref:Solute carrier family 25 member 44 n=1 Tax=Cacopsylla melanoneura TaxID=428564 RepID=A0A8D8TUB3_9HEMI